MDFTCCVDLGKTCDGQQLITLPPPEQRMPTPPHLAVKAHAFHTSAHMMVGGKGPDGLSGDFADPVTSPNDPVFMPHHANVDRIKMMWMEKNRHLDGEYYGYPESNNTIFAEVTYIRGSGESSIDGINLFDESGNLWGFTAESLGLELPSHAPGQLLTNADLLCMLTPERSPYKYA